MCIYRYNWNTTKCLLRVVWFFFQIKIIKIYITSFWSAWSKFVSAFSFWSLHIEVFITASWKFTFSWNLANGFWLEASFPLKEFTIKCLRLGDFFPLLPLYFFFSKKQHFPELGSEAVGQLCSKCESCKSSTELQPFMLFFFSPDICYRNGRKGTQLHSTRKEAFLLLFWWVLSSCAPTRCQRS